MASIAQHNFAAMQLQLQTLQLENSALTKDVCLKENYIQLKDQQFRVMQKRLEDLESVVATWKDKYLQQLNHASSSGSALPTTAAAAAAGNPNDDDIDSPRALASSPYQPAAATTAMPIAAAEAAAWVPWKHKVAPVTAASKSKSVQQALGLIERLSVDDRDKLRPMLAAITNSDGFAEALAATQWAELFSDVSEELSKILLLYLLPVLLENQREQSPGSTIQCYARTYTKQTMDLRVVCLPATTAAAAAAESAGSGGSGSASQLSTGSVSSPPATDALLAGDVTQPATSAVPSAAALTDTDALLLSPPAVVRSLSSSANALPLPVASPTSEFASALESADATDATEPPHLFDCVDTEQQHSSKRSAVPHGPRELHATKAVYISKPLPSAANSGGISSSSNVGTTSTNTHASRRYSLTPSRTSTMQSANSSESVRAASMLTSPFTGSSALSITDLGGDSDRRSSGSSSSSASKDGKIKKVLGSVMDRLNRHKPQLPTARPSLGDDESICDGCGRGPIVGTKWVCRTCRVLTDTEYELCDKCYGHGRHGKEHADALFTRIEEIVVAKCDKLATERALLTLVRVGICKANLKKYSFCLTWIADLLECAHTTDLRARALEISQIAPAVRSEFVRLLTDLLARYRRDIVLISEWQPVPALPGVPAAAMAAGGTSDDSMSAGASLHLDTLRIWVKDANDRASA